MTAEARTRRQGGKPITGLEESSVYASGQKSNASGGQDSIQVKGIETPRELLGPNPFFFVFQRVLRVVRGPKHTTTIICTLQRCYETNIRGCLRETFTMSTR